MSTGDETYDVPCDEACSEHKECVELIGDQERQLVWMTERLHFLYPFTSTSQLRAQAIVATQQPCPRPSGGQRA